MSSIRRGPRSADNFTTVANDFARDHRLSFKARGIGLYLLGHRDGFTTTAAKIANANGCGPGQVYSGLKELEDAGYLTRDVTRDDAGRVVNTDYLISDQVSDSFGVFPNGMSPNRETPNHKEEQGLEEQESKDLVSADARTETEPPQLVLLPPSEAAVKPAKNGTAEAFDRFWKVYPRKIAKQTARKAWDKAVRGVSPAVITAGAASYAAERKRTDPRGKFTKHPATWLNGGCWEDEAPADPESWRQFSEEIGSPAAYAADDWRRFSEQ